MSFFEVSIFKGWLWHSWPSLCHQCSKGMIYIRTRYVLCSIIICLPIPSFSQGKIDTCPTYWSATSTLNLMKDFHSQGICTLFLTQHVPLSMASVFPTPSEGPPPGWCTKYRLLCSEPHLLRNRKMFNTPSLRYFLILKSVHAKCF